VSTPLPQLPTGVADRFATEVLLVRHARSADVVPGSRESYDPQLHAEGVVQARALADRLRPKRIHAAYVSDLVRAQQTAEAVLAGRGLEATVVPDLREVNLGEWEGGGMRRAAAEQGPDWQRFVSAGSWDVIPGAEPDGFLRRRVVDAIDGIAATHEGQTVLVVSHGGAINAYLAETLGVERTFFTTIENASITLLRYGGRRRMVVTVNDCHHLYDPVLGRPG
jgi:probable phosphoglycerate mutase